MKNQRQIEAQLNFFAGEFPEDGRQSFPKRE